MVLCPPGTARATPVVPQNGFSGTRAKSANAAGSANVLSQLQILSHVSGESSASKPNPGTIAVHAQPEGLKSNSVTFSASPGSAPST